MSEKLFEHRQFLREHPEVCAEVEPNPLDAVKQYIRRFVSLSEHQARVIAVWVIHTHTIEAADTTPYLAVTSAEKQCGKSRLLEVLETIVDEPWKTDKATTAVLPRKIHAESPTLLLDEADANFGGEKEYSETLRGILNSGHRRGGKTTCCEGPPTKIEYRDFNTFSAKAIAAIGRLPDTISDRSIPIRLKRAARGERDRIQRFRRRDIEPEAKALKAEVEEWAKVILPGLRDARPQLPDELTDRQQDGAEPLLAIADAAGGNWPMALRQALISLCTDGQAADGSIRVQLLSDIRQTFDGRGVGRVSSADLASALAEIETSPWAEWSNGKPLSTGKLARLLKPFEVVPHSIRTDSAVLRGYEREDFADVWDRYLPPPPAQEGFKSATPLQTDLSQRIESTYPVALSESQIEPVAAQKREIVNTDAACSVVAFLEPPTGSKADKREKGEL